MKYRIKEIVDGLGNSEFILQKNIFWNWWVDDRGCSYRKTIASAKRDYELIQELEMCRKTTSVKYHEI